jgi:hypothetical protein
MARGSAHTVRVLRTEAARKSRHTFLCILIADTRAALKLFVKQCVNVVRGVPDFHGDNTCSNPVGNANWNQLLYSNLCLTFEGEKATFPSPFAPSI